MRGKIRMPKDQQESIADDVVHACADALLCAAAASLGRSVTPADMDRVLLRAQNALLAVSGRAAAVIDGSTRRVGRRR
jgi:2C-methyl-D-erythritol 2,4-cyclodiphosphate synthase